MTIVEPFLGGGAQFLGNGAKRLSIVDLGQDDEFLAAEAKQAIQRTQRAFEQPGEADQDFVALEVAEAIVDLLEMIEIEDQQAVVSAFACDDPLCARQLAQ